MIGNKGFGRGQVIENAVANPPRQWSKILRVLGLASRRNGEQCPAMKGVSKGNNLVLFALLLCLPGNPVVSPEQLLAAGAQQVVAKLDDIRAFWR